MPLDALLIVPRCGAGSHWEVLTKFLDPAEVWTNHGASSSLVYSDRSTLLQGELFACTLLLTGWKIRGRQQLHEIFAEVERQPSYWKLTTAAAHQLPPVDFSDLELTADVCHDKSGTGGAGSEYRGQSALTNQLWESQAFPIGHREGTLFRRLPIKAGDNTVAMVVGVEMAITAHRARLGKQLTLVLRTTLVGDGWVPDSQAGRGKAVSQDASGLLECWEQGDSPPVEKAMDSCVVTYPIVIVRPLSLTTALIGSTMFAKIDNSTDQSLIIESVHTRTSSCASKPYLPALLAPKDQYCISLQLQPELVSSHRPEPHWPHVADGTGAQPGRPQASGSKIVYPLSIKWKVEGARGSSWAQFGADCQTQIPTPIEVTIRRISNSGDPRETNAICVKLAITNHEADALDACILVGRDRTEDAQLEELWLKEIAGARGGLQGLAELLVNEDRLQLGASEVPSLIPLQPVVPVGLIDSQTSQEVVLSFYPLHDLRPHMMLPNLYLWDLATGRAFLIAGREV